MSATLYGRSALRIARRRRGLGSGGAAGVRRGLAAVGDDVHRKRAGLASRLRRPRRGAAVEGGDSRADRTSGGRNGATSPRHSRAGAPTRPRHGPPRRRADAGDELRAARRAAGVSGGGRRPRNPRRPRRRHLAPRARLAQRRAHGCRRCRPCVRASLTLLGRTGSRGRVLAGVGRDAGRMGVASLRHGGRRRPRADRRRSLRAPRRRPGGRRGAGGRSARGRERPGARRRSGESTTAPQGGGAGTCRPTSSPTSSARPARSSSRWATSSARRRRSGGHDPDPLELGDHERHRLVGCQARSCRRPPRRRPAPRTGRRRP